MSINKIDDEFYTDDSEKIANSNKKILTLVEEAERLYKLGYKYNTCNKAIKKKKFSASDINIIIGILRDYN